MIPENNLEEPDISQVAYELAAQLIRHLDNLEANTSAGITGLVFSLKSSFFPRSLFSQKCIENSMENLYTDAGV